MYANPVAGPIVEPVSFERHAHAFIQRRKRIQKMARFNIDELAQTRQKIQHDKCVKFTKDFRCGDLVAFRKEKRNEKSGKLRAQYSGPYPIAEINEQRHKYRLVPDREKVALPFPSGCHDLT